MNYSVYSCIHPYTTFFLLMLNGKAREGGIKPQIYILNVNGISWRMYAYVNDIVAKILQVPSS